VVAPTRKELGKLASKVDAPDVERRLKKRVVRTLIQDTIVDVHSSIGEVVVVVRWKAGVHTESRLPRRRCGQNSSQASMETVHAVGVLARICEPNWGRTLPQWRLPPSRNLS
jgi:hypothetical protein